MYHLDRRRFLALGLAATTASIAGCSVPAGGRSEPYAEWLPATDGGAVTAYIDFTLSSDAARVNPVLPMITPTGGASGGNANLAPILDIDDIDDPLVTFPVRTGGRVLGTAVLSMAAIGLGELVDPARPTEGVTELCFADGVTVGTGDIDASAVDETLRTGPEMSRFDTVETRDEFTLYELATDDDGFAAVSESAIAVADSREDVEAVLDTRRGDRERAAAAGDTFASLLDTAGEGHLLVGWEAPADLEAVTFGEPDDALAAGLVSTADDAVASITFAPDDDELTADFALDAAGDVNGARFDELLGSASSERSLDIEGGRVTASATYANDALGLDYVADEGTTAPTTVPADEDLPPEVADAVPDGAFEFTFKPEQEVVRVDFTAEFGAEKVTIRAHESGNESTTTTPGPIQYLNVFVDPDGDVVTVSVTVDGESGVVARYDVP